MNKDLKDLINSIEKESKSQAELEHIIQTLKEEINRLEFIVKEQQLLIENLRDQMKDEKVEQTELPSELDVLKDIITAQRKELEEKDNIIDKLNNQILEFDEEIVSSLDLNSIEKSNEEIINSQRIIVQLTEDNEEYKSQIVELNKKIEELQSNEPDSEDLYDDEQRIRESEELANFKKLNFQLMQENGLLRVEIESLKSKLQEKINLIENAELKNAYEKIESLTSEIKDYESKVKDLQDELSNLTVKVTISTEEAIEFAKLREEYDSLKSELLKNQQENKSLIDKITELNKSNKDLESVKVYSTPIPLGIPKKIKHSLFNRMYSLLDENNRNKIINFLIQDLKSKNSETKSNAIKILSQIKDNKVYDAFLEIIDDKDWLVRYNLIKAMEQFKSKSNEFKNLLKKLSKDVDVDVRELAVKILNTISE